MQEVGHFDHLQNGTVTFQVLRNEIVASRPLGIRVAWSGGGAHFIAAIGAEEGDLVLVGDPGSGANSLVDYATLETSYNGSGSVDTFLLHQVLILWLWRADMPIDIAPPPPASISSLSAVLPKIAGNRGIASKAPLLAQGANRML